MNTTPASTNAQEIVELALDTLAESVIEADANTQEAIYLVAVATLASILHSEADFATAVLDQRIQDLDTNA